jgi:7,8-didemethyl-8-hydroxy-5-deazariboflavin synthase CofH subunit
MTTTRFAERLMDGTRPALRDVLERALEDRELSEADVEVMLAAQGRELQLLCMVGDIARARDVGDEVSYVVNRNINSTNVCYVGCSFCGFARHKHEADAYDRGIDDVLARVREAWARGASEICIQSGIHPNKDGFWYRETIEAIKAEFPEIHIHGVSPEEIHWGHEHSNGMALDEYLSMLKAAGLGTVPGTAAEILDDEVRRQLSPRKLMTERWIEIITTAHGVGLRSSSTLMYGHIEQPHHIARHLGLLRSIQMETGGFTEFVPLGFIHHNTRLYKQGGARAGATMPEDLRMVAIGRLFLRPWIRNIQISWVKMGLKLAQAGLQSGANDFGGTLMEESISKAAGSEHGDHLEVEDIRRLIAEIGRPAYERTTDYGRRAERPAALPIAPLEISGAARAPLGVPSGY